MNLLTKLCFGISRAKPNKPMQVRFPQWSIWKGDEVILRSGKDKGKTGKITRVFRKKNAVVIDGINVRHGKKRSKVDLIQPTLELQKEQCEVSLSTYRMLPCLTLNKKSQPKCFSPTIRILERK